MLTLTRRVGECIWVTDDICVTVTEVRGRQVRLAILAPKDWRISRDMPPSQYQAEGAPRTKEP